MKILNLVLWCSILQVQQSAHCSDRPTKSEIDAIARSRTRRELARANQSLREQLRKQLIAHKALTNPPAFVDLEAGLGTPAPAGAGTGLGATPATTESTPRMRGRSASTEDLLTHNLGALIAIAQQQVDFNKQVYKKFEQYKRRIVYGSLLSGAAGVAVSTIINNHKTILGWFGL